MLLAGALLSLLAGLALGLLGGGGSLLMVPILVFVLGVEPRHAFPMSLVIVGITSAVSALRARHTGVLDLHAGVRLGLSGMTGAVVGPRLAAHLPSPLLLTVFGGVVMASAVAMLRPAARATAAMPAATDAATSPAMNAGPRGSALILSGLGVGLLTGMVGVGGGFLAVPALVVFGRLPFPRAAATSLVVIAMNCAAGLVGSWLHELHIEWALALTMAACATAGALFGMWGGRRLPVSVLRTGFAALILVLGTVIVLRPVLESLEWFEAAHRGAIAVLAGLLIVAAALLVNRLSAGRAQPRPPPVAPSSRG